TGEMLIGLEEVMLKEKPDYVVVFGDTNSTIAGALVAAKLHIPIGHIEAGLRSFNRKMPEEINRILTDVISSQLFCPTRHAVDLLKKEGIEKEIHCCGDIMYDALLHFLPLAKERSNILENLNLNSQQEGYYLFTMHSPENTEDPQRIAAIFAGLQACEAPIVYPVHPRMRKTLKSPEIAKILRGLPQLRMCDPLGYLDILQLQAGARKIITDSGGMQKEAFFLRRPCITIRDESEWVETMDLGWNILVGADTARLRSAIRDFNPVHPAGNVYGDGNTAEIIAEKIRMFLEDKKLRR
ncbi:MAG: UDP-N-acetylglucosamine 2-epimerase (non-hydrolyzing), partial [Candidatus Neomarinimicrobiota bacterium]